MNRIMTVQRYYEELARLNRRDRTMAEYEQGKRDCERGVPHQHKSEAYTQGYGEQYEQEEIHAAQ